MQFKIKFETYECLIYKSLNQLTLWVKNCFKNHKKYFFAFNKKIFKIFLFLNIIDFGFNFKILMNWIMLASASNS